MSTMRLETMTLSRNWETKGLEGSLRFAGTHGNVEVKLDEKLSGDILKLIAESMARATKELANNITAQVFEQANAALPSPDDFL